ncbi:NADP-dependent oxidoreductase [Photobacterium kasasachensis]|uniref:NADP-dependent oxidoreductase n=1 Tax=Photobacterium kasasachensis TaxID=2910240 RepID=UPI003D11AD20
MKAARIHKFGDINAIHLEESPVPEIADDEVLVKVVASAINPLDWKIRSGELRELIPIQFPHTLGWDFSGIVAKVGNKVTNFVIGDAVYSRPEVSRNGAHAEYIAVPATDIAPKPQTLSFAAAATLPIASITAWQSLFELGQLVEGQKVLIHAGAGSLGCIALQLANNAGAYVITTAAAEHHDFVKSLGADQVIDYQNEDFKDIVSDIDVVLDTIGYQVQLDSYSVLKPNGILVSVNTYPDVETAKRLGVQARFLSIKPNGDFLTQIAKWVDRGDVRPIVGYEFAFEDIHAAYQLSESGKAKGKIVIHIAAP